MDNCGCLRPGASGITSKSEKMYQCRESNKVAAAFHGLGNYHGCQIAASGLRDKATPFCAGFRQHLCFRPLLLRKEEAALMQPKCNLCFHSSVQLISKGAHAQAGRQNAAHRHPPLFTGIGECGGGFAN